jgi:ribosome-interacting GTPase 1
MPANLTPDYHRAEERFRAAKTTEERIAALEEMLRVIPKHKGTDGLQGDLKARLAKLRKEPPKKGAKASHSHTIQREGAGQVALVGPPNSGIRLCALTHATAVATIRSPPARPRRA